jgi:hypothetical protein
MRFISIILVLPLLTGCVMYPVIGPYSSERSAAVSGTLLDEHSRTPVSGADVFFTFDPKLHCQSDDDGKFRIGATRHRYWIKWNTLAGVVESLEPALFSDITITHTNWATQKINWNQTNQTILLQKLPEPSKIRPWMTFDGNGVILEDGGAERYLAPKPVQTSPGFARGPIHFGPYREGGHRAAYITNGALCMINVNFAQRVFDPRLTVSRGLNKPAFAGTAAKGFSWSFSPRYGKPTDLIGAADTFYVYKLEFIR